MDFYPAIDLMDGCVVRLKQGKKDQKTIYSKDPGVMAAGFASKGASWIHVVDLDAAFSGKQSNLESIKAISKTGLKVEVGGGVRSLEVAENLINNGVSRVIIGTAGVKDPNFLKEAVAEFGDKVAVGIDVLDGMVAIKGWVEKSQWEEIDFGKKAFELGVKTVIYTDISRDGMMQGPNFSASENFGKKTGLNVIVSGGVSTLEDLKEVAKLNSNYVIGAISGKAVYENSFSIKDGVKVFE